MTDKEKELDRFFMSGVTCDDKIEQSKKQVKALCQEIKEQEGKKKNERCHRKIHAEN